MLDTLELPFLFSCLSMLHRSTPLSLYRWSYAQEMETLKVRVSCMRVRVRVHDVCSCVCVWQRTGIRGAETGYVGNNTKHKKVSHDLKHRVDLFGFRKNLLHVVWRGECFPSSLAVCSDTTHGNIFWEAMGLREKRKRALDILFLLSFHTLFSSFLFFFFLIELHTSARHM